MVGVVNGKKKKMPKKFKKIPLDNAEKLMWKYLLTHGGVLEKKDYYGSYCNAEKTAKCNRWIEKFGIDWVKTDGVQDEWDMEFCGTFCDDCKVSYLEGKLVTKDGTTWDWYYEYDEPINVLELIKDIIPDPFEK